MRSIRFSLLVYFLSLLALALAAFSFLTYENARARLSLIQEGSQKMLTEVSLRDREAMEESYKRTRLALQTNHDAALLLKAQTMASQLAERYNFVKQERIYAGKILRAASPLLTAQQGPGIGLFYISALDNEVRHSWYSSRLLGQKQIDLQFVDDVLFHTQAERNPFYFQVYDDHGESVARSLSLGAEDLPLDHQSARKLSLCQPGFDHFELPSGKRLRCVMIRVPIVKLSVTRQFSSGDRRRGTPGPTPGAGTLRISSELSPVDPKEVERGNVAKVFLLYAKPVAEVEEPLAEIREKLDASQAALEAAQALTMQETKERSTLALASLRNKLLLISIGVFLTTLIGGIWIVRWGLSPLQRLTAAVSQVSERDFQLHIDRAKVPEELRPIVERLQQALASLQQAFSREKQAAADISHDLRTPISSLLATTAVCLRRTRSSEEYRTTIETCHEIGSQLKVLVERLLALARLDAGADKLQPEAVDVPELAEQCLTLVKPLAEEKGISVRMERNGPILVETDAGKLREVLTNLLDNAIQYNRPQGTIELAVERNRAQVQVEVRDTGIGIAPEAKQHLFERFYRADPSRQTETAHCGLGLAIVKGYVDLMGGKIEVDSVPGQGSTFRVLLPLPADDSLG